LGQERQPLLANRDTMKRAEIAMQQADERRAAFERAFGSSRPVPDMAIYGSDGPVDGSRTAPFESTRGRLSFPLAGRAEVQRAHEPSDGPTGITLVAARDTPVSSVFPGRVAFAGPTEHGSTVVVDHGDHYFSLYGRLDGVEVSVGDALPERGRIGWVRRRGGRPASLYFELRQEADVLDAATWLGL
jgi:septal ring factor EnvC (AmiA/AmiB activator)